MNNNRQREFDLIAGSRIAKIGDGIPLHVAISNKNSITFRNKMRRMRIKGEVVDELIRLMDEVGIQKTLESQSIGVRFSTVQKAARKPKIFRMK
jgi:hypothetical protein